MNRVLRVTEEVGRLSDEVSQRYGFEKHAVLGVRNRLAHAYGDVDREIIWAVIEHDFDELLASCALYCEDNGRPSVDPVVLFKIVLIQHIYGISSLRRTLEEVSMNLAYRCSSDIR